MSKSLLTWLISPTNSKTSLMSSERVLEWSEVSSLTLGMKNEQLSCLRPCCLMNLSQSAKDLPPPLHTFWSLLHMIKWRCTPIGNTAQSHLTPTHKIFGNLFPKAFPSLSTHTEGTGPNCIVNKVRNEQFLLLLKSSTAKDINEF